MAVAANADDYAATRVGIFFPGVTPYYDGQCVSLVKWFMGEMAGVADWNAARGNAKDVGRTLVAQGLARQVGWNERRRGDVIVYDYGQYGHIAVQLSNGRVFEQNVNMPGTTRRWVVDDYVYSARIGSENEAWRAGKNPLVYRLNGYAEPGQVPQGSKDMIPDDDNYYWRWGKKAAMQIRGRELSRAEFSKYLAGQSGTRALEILSDDPEADRIQEAQTLGVLARKDNWQGQIYGLLDQVKALGSRPTVEERDALVKQAQELQQSAKNAEDKAAAAVEQARKDREELAKLEAERAASEKTGNSFLLWLGGILNKLTGSK